MSQKVISFHYLLTNKTGEEIDSSRGGAPFSFIEGSGQIIPGLEKELLVLTMGQKKKINVPAAEAYGLRDESLIITVEREKIPAQDVKVGDRFKGGSGEKTLIFTVIALAENTITLDGNHPLAGQDLTFDVELVATREATQEEIEHGHMHGPDGHHHH